METPKKELNVIDTIMELGRLLGGEVMHADKGKAPFMLVPDGVRVEDLEQYLDKPIATRATVKHTKVTSFVDYVNEHKVDASRIFARFTSDRFTLNAVIDYHEPLGIAARGLHTAELAMQYSDQWKLWRANSGKMMRQNLFADFIEENVDDFTQPKAAEMLEVVRDFRATRKATFGSVVNAANGDHQFAYTIETTPQKTTRSNLEVPEAFEIAVPVFDGEDTCAVKAWLRYDISTEGHLALQYKLCNPEKILRAEGERILADIKERTSIIIYDGNVEIH